MAKSDFVWSLICLAMALLLVPILWIIFYHHPISGAPLGLGAFRMSIATSPFYLPIIFSTLSLVIFKKIKLLSAFVALISFCCIGYIAYATTIPSWAFYFVSEVYLAYFLMIFLSYLPYKKS